MDSLKNDIKEYLEENFESSELMEMLEDDRDAFEENLYDTLWTCDSVTGNASGSYTFSREKAKENVIDNMDLLVEVLEMFYGDDTKEVGKKFMEQNWEHFDVSIRCYLLSNAISEALDEIEREA
jgi:hypothetical protein